MDKEEARRLAQLEERVRGIEKWVEEIAKKQDRLLWWLLASFTTAAGSLMSRILGLGG